MVTFFADTGGVDTSLPVSIIVNGLNDMDETVSASVDLIAND